MQYITEYPLFGFKEMFSSNRIIYFSTSLESIVM